MISEWFLTLASTVIAWLVGLLDGITIPDWLLTLDDSWNAVVAPLDGVAVWVPWALVIPITLLCVATYFVCLVIKYARAIASYIPFFGGAG